MAEEEQMDSPNVEERLREANKHPLYICPDRHLWVNEPREDQGAPLVNIKCPTCGKTAMRHYRAVPASSWPVREVEKLEMDVCLTPERENPDG